MFNTKLFLSIISSVLLSFSLAHADEGALVKEKCGICHGETGNSLDENVPSIAGFSRASILDALEEYKLGDRKGDKYAPKGGKETGMGEVANSVSEADTQLIASYLSKQTFKAVKQDFDTKLAEKGEKIHTKECAKCHTSGASDPTDDAGILAGQYKAYLQKQFDKIAIGERSVPSKMKRKFKRLSEKDRTALISFYISQQ